MAGVVSAQHLEREDDSMQDASMLSVEQSVSRPESALASPGDPMDISPLPAANQQHRHVVGQQAAGPSSQPVDQFSEWVPGGFCTRPLLSKYQSASSGPLNQADSAGSMGLKTRNPVLRSPNRFSPKDKDIALLKKKQLKRLPLAVQTKLPTSHKPFPSLQEPKNAMSGSQLFRNHFIANGTSVPSSSISRYNTRPYQFNRPLFMPPAQQSVSNGFMAGARNDAGTGDSSVEPTSEIPAAPAATGQNGDEASRGGFRLQRKRAFEEEEPTDGPSPFVSPSYRKFRQADLEPALTSSANETRQETSVENNEPFTSPQRLHVAPPTSTLISPLKPNTSTANPSSANTADNIGNSASWNEMRELDQVFRDQGIAPLQEEPPCEPKTPMDPLKEPILEFKYRMPGSWPDDDPLYFPEPLTEEPSVPVQGPGLVGDHSLLMSATPDASPAPAVPAAPAAQNPVDAATSSQGPDVPSISSQDLETSQSQGPEMTPEQQLKNSTVRPSMSLYDQLHRIYANSWEATQCVVTAAISLAGSFKRHAVAIFEERPSRQSTSHTRTTSTSPARASPARANVRALPEDQRRRLKSNQWRRDRGFPTVQNYPFPNLSFDAPPAPSSTARLRHIKSSQKPVTPRTKTPKSHNASSTKPSRGQISKSRAQRSSLVQSLSPDIQRRLRLCPTKRKPLDSRRNRSLAHAVQSGKLALNEVPGKQTRLVTAQQAKALARTKLKATQKDPILKSIIRKPSTEVDSPKRTAPRRVRFVADTAPGDDPSLVGTYLHPAFPKPVDVPSSEEKENEPPKKPTTAHDREDPDNDLQAWLQSDFPFGRPVSAVRLFTPGRPLPPGRTESIYAAEWRKIEEEEKKKKALEAPEAAGRIRPEGPAVRPLPKNWEAKVAELVSLPSTRQVATTLSGDPLLKKDVATCYTPIAWLNDEIINSYLAVLIDYMRRTHGNAGRHDKPKFHAFNSFFFSNLRDKGYASVRRWAQRAKIGGESLLNVDTVFIPVHDSSHWTLMVVSPTSKTIEYFDSLGAPSDYHVFKVKEWLKGELAARYVDAEWTVAPCVSPQQNNGSDCGAFLLSTAKAIAIGMEPQSYGAKDIPLLRKKIVAELMAGGLSAEFDPVGKTGEVLM